MDLNEEIAKVAYELYERDGKQDGRDREHWLEAERIVEARRMKPSKAESGRERASQVKKTAPKETPLSAKKGQEAPKPKPAAAADKSKKTTGTPRSK